MRRIAHENHTCHDIPSHECAWSETCHVRFKAKSIRARGTRGGIHACLCVRIYCLSVSRTHRKRRSKITRSEDKRTGEAFKRHQTQITIAILTRIASSISMENHTTTRNQVHQQPRHCNVVTLQKPQQSFSSRRRTSGAACSPAASQS